MAQIRLEKERAPMGAIGPRPEEARQTRNTILAVIAVVLVVILVYGIMEYTRATKTEKLRGANDIFAEAMDAYFRAIDETGYSTTERQQAMKEVVDLARKVREQYPNTEIAEEALFLEGDAYYSMGDDLAAGLSQRSVPNTDEAIRAYTQYVAAADTDFERAKGNLALGYAEENAFFLTNDMQRLNNAMTIYSRLSDDEDAGFLRYEAMMAAARNLAFQDREEEAIALYRQVLKARPLPENDINEEGASPSRRTVAMVRELQEQYTLAASAEVELLRMGLDLDEVRGETKTEAETPAAEKAEGRS